jgi:hypothetical protein
MQHIIRFLSEHSVSFFLCSKSVNNISLNEKKMKNFQPELLGCDNDILSEIHNCINSYHTALLLSSLVIYVWLNCSFEQKKI